MLPNKISSTSSRKKISSDLTRRRATYKNAVLKKLIMERKRILFVYD